MRKRTESGLNPIQVRLSASLAARSLACQRLFQVQHQTLELGVLLPQLPKLAHLRRLQSAIQLLPTANRLLSAIPSLRALPLKSLNRAASPQPRFALPSNHCTSSDILLPRRETVRNRIRLWPSFWEYPHISGGPGRIRCRGGGSTFSPQSAVLPDRSYKSKSNSVVGIPKRSQRFRSVCTVRRSEAGILGSVTAS